MEPCHISSHQNLHLLSVALFLLNSIILSQQGQEQHRTCGGVTYENYNDTESVPPAAQLDPAEAKPFIIYFVMDPAISKLDYEALLYQIGSINDKLKTMLQGKKLPSDHRFPRQVNRNSSTPACLPMICGGFPIPAPYVKPCVVGGVVVPESGVTENISEAVLKPSKDVGGVNLVVYLSVRTGPYKDTGGCGGTMVGNAAVCGWDPIDHRPTHGRVALCYKPSGQSKRRVRVILLHEILHIMRMPSRAMSTWQLVQGQNVSWRKVTRKLMRADGAFIHLMTEVIMTPKVLEAVRERFDCSTLEGAEIGTMPGSEPGTTILDSYHWSWRLFPDELGAPLETDDQRMTKLTLAVLQDTGWYAANWSAAEQSAFIRPNKQGGCDAALKSSHEIFARIRTQPGAKWKLHMFGALCDPTGQAGTTRCSRDGKTRYECGRRDEYSNYCDILHPQTPFDISSDYLPCAQATTQISMHQLAGFAFGPESMCITWLSLPTDYIHSPAKPLPYGACFRYKCQRNQTILFTPNLRHGYTYQFNTRCSPVTCTPDNYTVGWKPTPRCRMAGRFVCPPYEDVCADAIAAAKQQESSAAVFGSWFSLCALALLVVKAFGTTMVSISSTTHTAERSTL